MPRLLRLIATSDPARMIQCLEHIVETAPSGCDIRLQTTPVAFENGRARRNTTAWNYKELKTFAEWDSTRLDGAVHKAGLFVTRVETSVGRLPEHCFPDWHAWGAILRNDGLGKTLVIWDPDGPRNWIHDEDLRYGSLMGMQHNLIKYCKKKYRLNAIWLGGGHNPQSLCISLSRDWLESVVRGGIPSLEEFRLVRP
jgi:hypothetical protein